MNEKVAKNSSEPVARPKFKRVPLSDLEALEAKVAALVLERDTAVDQRELVLEQSVGLSAELRDLRAKYNELHASAKVTSDLQTKSRGTIRELRDQCRGLKEQVNRCRNQLSAMISGNAESWQFHGSLFDEDCRRRLMSECAPGLVYLVTQRREGTTFRFLVSNTAISLIYLDPYASLILRGSFGKGRVTVQVLRPSLMHELALAVFGPEARGNPFFRRVDVDGHNG